MASNRIEAMSKPIVIFGSLNIDLVVQVPRLPGAGETLPGDRFVTVPGGKGANQAIAAARMGGRVAMIGCVGSDAFGDMQLANLAQAGVDHSRVRRAATSTGTALITVAASGKNTIVYVAGANATLAPEDALANEDLIAGAAGLVAQLETPLPAVTCAVELARRHTVPVFLNPSPAAVLPEALLGSATYLIPNETEAALLTGLPVASADDALRAATRLRELTGGVIVLTLGERGALACDSAGDTFVPAFRVNAVDSTAAGDAFLGAFVVAVAEGQTPVEAARWGCAAGALACTVFGAQPSLPTREAAMKLLKGSQ